jgi:DDE family transposase/transposase-like protein DUF772
MIGKRKTQAELFDVGNVFPFVLKPGTFHAQLAHAAPRLFSDEDFARLYSERIGRPSVPPSMLALTLLLQQEAGISDEETIERTGCDLRWAAVLRRAAGEPLCAKSTFQLFRAHLVLHDEVRKLFQKSILEAKRAGLLKGKALRVAIDTKPVLGRGAVQDTYNLVACGIRLVATALAMRAGLKPDAWLLKKNLGRYAEPSVKGSACIDWSDEEARGRLLTELVQDARHVLSLAEAGCAEAVQAAELLSALLLQDIQVRESLEGPTAKIKEGTVSGRIPSATDPEQRHGRKSASNRFTGHKASIAADIQSEIILAVDVLPGNAGDATGALALVQQAEANAELAVQETLGDCAYGGVETRQAFADDGRVLHAKVGHEAQRGVFPRSAFVLDLENHTVTCPEGHTTGRFIQTDHGRTFLFGAVCRDCPLRAYCTTNAQGRTIQVHPQEARRQAARAWQKTPEGRTHLRERVVVEHRLARLGQLGIGQARYRGRAMTRFQLMMAATIANLRRTWNWQEAQRAGQTDPSPNDGANLFHSAIQRLHDAGIHIAKRLQLCITTRCADNSLALIETIASLAGVRNTRFRLNF